MNIKHEHINLKENYLRPEASLIVTDFTISVYGSSCNHPLFFHAHLRSLSFSLLSPRKDGMTQKREKGDNATKQERFT